MLQTAPPPDLRFVGLMLARAFDTDVPLRSLIALSVAAVRQSFAIVVALRSVGLTIVPSGRRIAKVLVDERAVLRLARPAAVHSVFVFVAAVVSLAFIASELPYFGVYNAVFSAFGIPAFHLVGWLENAAGPRTEGLP